MVDVLSRSTYAGGASIVCADFGASAKVAHESHFLGDGKCDSCGEKITLGSKCCVCGTVSEYAVGVRSCPACEMAITWPGIESKCSEALFSRQARRGRKRKKSARRDRMVNRSDIVRE